MRTALISDIHGNCVALDAVLADLRTRGVDKVVCLGDAVQGGPQPVETVQRLRKLACPVVMGNADAWLLDKDAVTAEKTTKRQRTVRSWTIGELSKEDLSFIRGFRPTVEVQVGRGVRLLCFHGSPSSFDDVLLPDTPAEKWERLLGKFSPSLMAGGHTHAQQLRRVGEGLFFNPGSVGLVYDVRTPRGKIRAYPWGEYAILEHFGGRQSLEFRRVPYDLRALTKAIRESGRPYGSRLAAEYE